MAFLKCLLSTGFYSYINLCVLRNNGIFLNQGVTLAMILSFGFMAFIGVGQTVYNNQGKLPIQSLSLDGTCPMYPDVNVTGWQPEWIPWKERDDNALTQLFTISPLWYPAYGKMHLKSTLVRMKVFRVPD